MSQIESIIEFDCYDEEFFEKHPNRNLQSQCNWVLREKDVPDIAAAIKRALIEEVRKAPHTWEDALEVIQEF